MPFTARDVVAALVAD